MLILTLLLLYAICLDYANTCEITENKRIEHPIRKLYNMMETVRVNYCPEKYQNSNKTCNLQGSSFDQKWFHIHAGYNCYNYTNPTKFHDGAKYNNTVIIAYICQGLVKRTYGTKLNDGQILWYDYTNSTAKSYIRKTFKTDAYFDLWVECCEQADKCCNNVMTNENILSDKNYCPAIWDSWSCFPRTKVNTTAKLVCSNQAYSSPPLCELQSEKTCYGKWNTNATWKSITDYTTCSITPYRTKRLHFHVIALSISTVLTFPAIVIFLSLEKFRRTTRIVLHRNLIIAIVIRNLLSIMTEQIIILDSLESLSESQYIMANNSVACRVLAFFENAAKNAMYSCMLVDGFYLHKIIVRSFADEPNIYGLYGVAAGLSLIPSLIWAICNGAQDIGNCWMVDGGYQIITDVFRIAILAANILLLADIIRSIITKLKYSSSSKQTRATLNATLFLIPLFGIHIFFIMYRGIFNDNRCSTQDIYYYISYSMEGSQGVMVAVLFCYINAEVHKELKNAYRKYSNYLEQRYNLTLPGKEFLRRRTTTTNVTMESRLTLDNSSRPSGGRFSNNSVDNTPKNGRLSIVNATPISSSKEKLETIEEHSSIPETNETIFINNTTASSDI